MGRMKLEDGEEEVGGWGGGRWRKVEDGEEEGGGWGGGRWRMGRRKVEDGEEEGGGWGGGRWRMGRRKVEDGEEDIPGKTVGGSVGGKTTLSGRISSARWGRSSGAS